ncbi:hypothetical protein DPMN_053777 [Dreissena polymorpha]|uniref:Uncharacterized protein n=1 Tax=Dreissena polymorpha TaxID=45954 RepID=A0A9D4CMR1_DREPO|nr:hypothetical protein DPMN_053777 [Dreissena polymorpha]
MYCAKQYYKWNTYINDLLIFKLFRTGVRSVCILLPVLGLTWLIGIFSVNRDTLVFQYLFAISNSLQVGEGLFAL